VADLGSRSHRQLLVVVGVLLAATVAGLVVLWPSAEPLPGAEAPMEDLVTGEVLVVDHRAGEPDPVFGGPGGSVVVTVRVLDGPDEGLVTDLEVSPEGYPEFAVGDRLALAPAEVPGSEVRYYITDFQRLPALAWLLGLFVLAVVAIGRWHGVRSLLGLALSLAIVIRFVVPAILEGRSPPVVALVGALAVMIVTLYLTHGVNEMTTSAVVGTGVSLTLTVGLGLLFIDQGKITGYASDQATFARFAVEGLDLQGLVLAGLIIAALGVLDDVTISQASTVFALHDTDRRLPWSTLFARAMKVGRDHIASVVNTLFLAYAGASLALLVLFSTSGLPAGEIVNSEILAQEIIKTVVGSLGLIAAVPLTTALAATVAVRRPADAPPLGGGHLHGHGAATAIAGPAVHGDAAGQLAATATRADAGRDAGPEARVGAGPDARVGAEPDAGRDAGSDDRPRRAATDAAGPDDEEAAAAEAWARYLASGPRAGDPLEDEPPPGRRARRRPR
jgi:uncharacterized membrane protein